MKKCVGLIVSLLLLYGTAMADFSEYGVSFGYGEADADIDFYRVGLKKEFSSRWFETLVGSVSGCFELSYNRSEPVND